MTELPTTFGKYYLTEKLATGGMAEIYLAKLLGPSGFEKQLVIKQIHPSLSGQRPFVDMFVAEAKTLVTLAHGNIVPVYELGVVDDTYYIAMDYIDGPTLYRLTETMSRRDARMPPALAAWIAARILDGLDYAHRKGEGVIHRDLSPRNVMLSRDGEVKLVDFGIAVTLGGPEAPSRESAPTGSFPYMSPEQARRESLTIQTDLFSAGVLLWEMLTGKRLFARPDPDATLRAVLDEPIPSPSSVRPDVPPKLDELVMRALERDRATRWQSASEMIAPLQKYLYALDDPPGPRSLAALVATYCPPETRRLPTHADAPEPDAGERGADGAGASHGADAAVSGAASGPSTAVIPRPPAGPSTAVIPRGRPQRHQSFATNIEIAEKMVSDTISEAPIARPAPKPLPIPGREPPSRAGLVMAGLVAIGLAVATVVIFLQGRERVLHLGEDAAVAPDAGGAANAAADATAADEAVTVTDAQLLVNAPADAAAAPRDAAARHGDAAGSVAVVRPDAGTATSGVDAGARATATLTVGADPWGEIYVDGAAMGRTPRELVVAAGHHTVEIVFPAETPPRKQTFSVDLGAGEKKPLQADFTN